jgi:hypothetical protein
MEQGFHADPSDGANRLPAQREKQGADLILAAF